MTEEEYFIKNFPDSCYYDKPLSPHWDYFQFGVEFGERESEKKIEDLERKLEQTEKDLADYQFNYPAIKELKKEINNYKLAEIEAKDIIAELEEKLANADYQLEGRDLEIKELQEELTKAKEIVKNLMVYVPVDLKEYEEAKQFISEVEK